LILKSIRKRNKKKCNKLDSSNREKLLVFCGKAGAEVESGVVVAGVEAAGAGFVTAGAGDEAS
jgi:hypothetical protein